MIDGGNLGIIVDYELLDFFKLLNYSRFSLTGEF